MNNAVFRKTMEPNYHITKCFTGYLLAIGMKKKKKILINKPVYLGLFNTRNS